MTNDRPLLPTLSTVEEYGPLRGDPAIWLPAMRAIARRHGLDADALYAERAGTNVVFRAGDDAWIKLIVPLWAEDYDRERCSLAAVQEIAAVPAPRLLADGVIEGWPYLVMECVEGRSIVTVWADLPREGQSDLAHQVGSLMARLHRIETAGMGALQHDWARFVRRRREGCGARHVEAGAPARWAAAIDDYLAGVPALDDPGQDDVFLHADITDEHVLVAERGGRWVITGLIDFADAMLGQPLYEFAAPAVFLTQRKPWAQRALLRGYGFGDADLTEDLARRLTAYVLLHRFGKLREMLRFCPAPAPTTVAELQEALFAFDR